MIKCPNASYIKSEKEKYARNDLYRMFRRPFDILLNDQFDEGGQYREDTYVHVNEDLEQEIEDELDSSTNLIIPIVGNKGVGKTHLLMSIFARKFKVDRIKANAVHFITNDDGGTDVLFYVSFDRFQIPALKDPLMLAAPMMECLCTEIKGKFQVNFDENEFQKFIDETKRLVGFYPEELKQYSIPLMELKYLITKVNTCSNYSIRNLIMVYDDFESLSQNAQEDVIINLANVFECLKSNRESIYYKFFVCMRKTTYSILEDKQIFDTHRFENELLLNDCPKLQELFQKRFDLIDKLENIRDNRDNKENWDEARLILFRLTEKLDSEGEGILYELSNHSVCETLKKFSAILSNRKWTQQDKNKYSAFKIEGPEYFINRVNIYKVLFRGEREYYYRSKKCYEPNIFYRPGLYEYDLLCLYTLSYFDYLETRGGKEYCPFDTLFLDFTEVFGNEETLYQKLKIIVSYYIENELLKSDDMPKEEDMVVYHITSKGRFLLNEFLSESILFEIYRDTFNLDTDIYENVYISDKLSQEELFDQFFTYIKEFWKHEKTIIEETKNKESKKYHFNVIFGNESITSRMLAGLLNSVDVSINILSKQKESTESREMIKKSISDYKHCVDAMLL